MTATRFTKLIGCTVPIQQAGMGSLAPPELAAAVSEAGGLGMLGTARGGLSPTTLSAMLDRLIGLTSKPFGVNFIVSPLHLQGGPNRPPLDLHCIEIAARSARAVEFFYGEPDSRLVEMGHAGGALAAWQVGSREEAIAAEAARCDFVVAQGIGAGGHVRGTVSTFPLVEDVLGTVRIPVLAAGGIGSAKPVAAALAVGADGVRVGTRFVATHEAGAHPEYVAVLIAAWAEDTVYTGAFHLGWPDAPHRVLRSCVVAAEAFRGDVVGETARLDGTRMPILRFGTAVADQTVTGAIGAMSLWAGESVVGVTQVQSAAEVVRELAVGAEAGGR